MGPRQDLLNQDNGNTHISGYYDANWVGSPMDRFFHGKMLYN